jgi:hypothetical protein
LIGEQLLTAWLFHSAGSLKTSSVSGYLMWLADKITVGVVFFSEYYIFSSQFPFYFMEHLSPSLRNVKRYDQGSMTLHLYASIETFASYLGFLLIP